MLRKLGVMVVVLLLADAVFGGTITVRRDGSGDYATLQPALDVAASGDTVLIGPGEYTEWTIERLPGYSWDIKTFGRVKCQNLTLIGAGMNETILGPVTSECVYATFSPQCLEYDQGAGELNVSDLTVRNSYAGISVAGTLHMDRCHVVDCDLGVFWSNVGSGGWIKDSQIDINIHLISPIGFDIGDGGGGSNIFMANCSVESAGTIRGILGMNIRNCDLGGVNLYFSSSVYVSECRTPLSGDGAIAMVMGDYNYCEIHDSDLAGSNVLAIGNYGVGSRFVVANSRLQASSGSVLLTQGRHGRCVINNCDLVKGVAPMVDCSLSTARVVHDLTNNFWGTTSEADIQSWIIDSNDNPSIATTVLYAPFAGQTVPAEATTWGDLKALFR